MAKASSFQPTKAPVALPAGKGGASKTATSMKTDDFGGKQANPGSKKIKPQRG